MKAKYIVIAMVLILTLEANMSSAAGLRHWWGVEVGDEFRFDLEIEQSESVVFDSTILLEVKSTPNLTDTYSSISRIPLVDVDQTFLNGTSLSLNEPWNKALEHLAYPIGDWWLLSNYIEAEDMVDYEIIEDQDFWGYEWRNIFETGITTVQASLKAVYFKDDGFLSYYEYTICNQATNATIEHREASRLDIQLGFGKVLQIIGVPLIVGVVGIATILIGRRIYLQRL